MRPPGTSVLERLFTVLDLERKITVLEGIFTGLERKFTVLARPLGPLVGSPPGTSEN